MPEFDPRSVVRRYVEEVLNGHDPGAADELIADATIKQRVIGFRSAFPDLRVETKHLVADGPLVAGHFKGHATHLGLFQGCPPTGRSWTATCTAIYRVETGQIVDAWINWDWLALMEQLGCVERVATVSA